MPHPIHPSPEIEHAAPLASPSPCDILEQIVGHLGAAVMQALPSDDQIILDHVRRAHELAKLLWTTQRSAKAEHAP